MLCQTCLKGIVKSGQTECGACLECVCGGSLNADNKCVKCGMFYCVDCGKEQKYMGSCRKCIKAHKDAEIDRWVDRQDRKNEGDV